MTTPLPILLLMLSTLGCPHPELTRSQAEQLVLATPLALRFKSSGGCPAADLTDSDNNSLGFQVRDHCVKTASGFVDNLQVNLCDGMLTRFPDGPVIDSKKLRQLRKKFFGDSRK
jgi:hypothetical protein